MDMEISEEEIENLIELTESDRDTVIENTESVFKELYDKERETFKSYNPHYTISVYDTLNPITHQDDILYCRYCDYLQTVEDKETGTISYNCLGGKTKMQVQQTDKCHYNFNSPNKKSILLN